MLKKRSCYKIARAPRYNADLLTEPSLTISQKNRLIPATLINFSRGGLAFKVRDPLFEIPADTLLPQVEFRVQGELFYSGRMRVAHTRDEQGACFLGACAEDAEILVDDIIRLSRAQKGALHIQQQVYKNMFNIRPNFMVLVLELKTFFKEMKYFLEEWAENEKAQWYLFKEEEQDLLKYLFGFFQIESTVKLQAMSKIYTALSEEEKQQHKEFFRDHLNLFFMESPFAKRSFEKPRGYPGDYLVMHMNYRQEFIGETLFGKLMNKFLTSYIPCHANMERLDYLVQLLRKTYQRAVKEGRHSVRVMSLGLGPGREIEIFLENFEESNFFEFTCVDWDEEAIEFARKKIFEVRARKNRKTAVQFIHGDVVAMLRDTPLECMKNQDLIYASGLFDYLPDSTARRIVKHFYDLLGATGKLLIVNASPKDPSMMETEFIGDWLLTRRSPDQLRNLITDLPSTAATSLDRDNQGVYTYMNVSK